MSFPRDISDRGMLVLIVIFAFLSLFALCLFVVLIRYWRDDEESSIVIITKDRTDRQHKNELLPTDNSSMDESRAGLPEIIQIDHDNTIATASVLAGTDDSSSSDESSEDEILRTSCAAPRIALRCCPKLDHQCCNIDDEASISPLPPNIQLTVSGNLRNRSDGDSSIVQDMKAAVAGLRGEVSSNAALL